MQQTLIIHVLCVVYYDTLLRTKWRFFKSKSSKYKHKTKFKQSMSLIFLEKTSHILYHNYEWIINDIFIEKASEQIKNISITNILIFCLHFNVVKFLSYGLWNITKIKKRTIKEQN